MDIYAYMSRAILTYMPERQGFIAPYRPLVGARLTGNRIRGHSAISSPNATTGTTARLKGMPIRQIVWAYFGRLSPPTHSFSEIHFNFLKFLEKFFRIFSKKPCTPKPSNPSLLAPIGLKVEGYKRFISLKGVDNAASCFA